MKKTGTVNVVTCILLTGLVHKALLKQMQLTTRPLNAT